MYNFTYTYQNLVAFIYIKINSKNQWKGDGTGALGREEEWEGVLELPPLSLSLSTTAPLKNVCGSYFIKAIIQLANKLLLLAIVLEPQIANFTIRT